GGCQMTTQEAWMGRPLARMVERGTSRWWVPLLIGILWLIYAFIVLSFTYKTVWAVVIFAAVAFIFTGIGEFVLTTVLESWRWLHALAGVLCIVAGIVALVWPGQTFLVMAGIIGWFLLFRGTFNIVESLFIRDYVEQWWLILITGILQVGIALWAVGYAGRSIAVLVVWVGAWALTEGIMNIWAAFRIRSVNRQAGTLAEPPAAPVPPAPA
ncbi:MAG TPA: DUF308 domain-containing protein, partial [Propionibacteriaceae bacterium]|nr:DUF308 domain-containing protein [Propionibacteriaceae bacterium]